MNEKLLLSALLAATVAGRTAPIGDWVLLESDHAHPPWQGVNMTAIEDPVPEAGLQTEVFHSLQSGEHYKQYTLSTIAIAGRVAIEGTTQWAAAASWCEDFKDQKFTKKVQCVGFSIALGLYDLYRIVEVIPTGNAGVFRNMGMDAAIRLITWRDHTLPDDKRSLPDEKRDACAGYADFTDTDFESSYGYNNDNYGLKVGCVKLCGEPAIQHDELKGALVNFGKTMQYYNALDGRLFFTNRQTGKEFMECKVILETVRTDMCPEVGTTYRCA